MRSNTVTNVDEYIAEFPATTAKLLTQLRELILKTAPKAEEIISYGMPAYKYHGQLIYFAGYKNHIGFYPMPSAVKMFKRELEGLKTAKGSIQFPLDKRLPVTLIKKIIVFRMKENLEKASLRSPRKKTV